MDSVLIKFLRRIADDSQPTPSSGLVNDILETAKYAILERRYPYGNYPKELGADGELTKVDALESRFLDLQLRIAIEIYNRMGAEGQLAHRESGVDRTYATGFISQHLLRTITPLVGVL